MKKLLLLILMFSFTISGWGQISEFLDSNNLAVELNNGGNPSFVELNNQFYFIGENGSDVLYSIDTNNTLTTEFDTAGLVGSNSLESLTAFNGQLYFVASNNGNIDSKRLYRLIGNNAAQLISNDVIVTGFDEMVVWDGELYFSGKLNITSENALLKYDGNTITTVNNVTPSVDYNPLRFAVNTSFNALFFYTRVGDFSATEGLWRLNIAQKNAGNTTISQIGTIDFIDFFNFPPAITAFDGRIYSICRTENDSERFLYQVNGTTLSRVNNTTGFSHTSFHHVQTNNGGTVYNNKLAIFRSSIPASFINDKLVLLSADNSTQEYDLPNNVSGQQFFGELNDALLFYGIDQGGSIEYLYEFRENTITDVIQQTRVVHNYLNGQSQRTYWGDTFNGKFYFYGASINDINRRVLHEYDPKILNYDPILNTQEQVDFFGNLGFEKIVGSNFSIQNFTTNGGTAISDLSFLSTLSEIPSTIISDTELTDLSGLENLTVIADIEIFNNTNLASFCALQPWASNNPGSSSDWIVNGNAVNPTFTELQNLAACQSPCNGNIILTSQEEVNAFGLENCTLITGSLTISDNGSGTPITNLSPLNGITEITEQLVIDGNPGLISLSGLESLNQLSTSASNNGDLRIANNPELNTIEALSGLTQVFALTIFNNDKLSSLEGLHNITVVSTTVAGFLISGNAILSDLNGLRSLTEVEFLEIQNNDSLTSLLGLENLNDIFGIFINNNTNLASFCTIQPWASNNVEPFDYNVAGNAYNPTFTQLQSTATCSACSAMAFTDTNLKAFFLDPANSSRILDNNGVPVTGLIVGGEVCTERAIDVFEINLDGGYNNTPITSLGDLVGFSNLGRLNIGGAQLTGNIDISPLVNLEVFEGSGNEITSLTASSANAVLTRIDASFQGTNEDVLTAVNFNGISIPLLESLSLQNNRSLTSIDLTKTPRLSIFRPDNTGITALDLTQIENMDGFDSFYLKDDENDGALQEIDLRNNLGSFNVNAYSLDATGHPNLTCVLVNQGDLTTAQNNVTNNTWLFDNTDVVKTTCTPNGPYEVEVYIEVDEAEQDGSGTYTYFHDEDSASPIEISFNVLGTTATEFPQYQVNINTRENTAQNAQDYEAKSENITLTTVDGGGISDNDIQTLQLFEDNDIEDQESFFIDITPIDNTIVLIDPTDGLGTTLNLGETLTFQVFVRDSENPEFRIIAIDATATEEGTTPASIQIGAFDANSNQSLTNRTSNDISIDFNTTGSATIGADYTITSSPVLIGSGATAVSFDITPIDDNDQEQSETVIIDLTNSSVGNIASGTNGQATVNIIDNDSTGGPDTDNDGIIDTADNCPTNSNADQADLDNDTIGDVCDPDIDGDGTANEDDAFPEDNTETNDNDNDGTGDNADPDDDNDGVLDADDNCPLVFGTAAENGCPVGIGKEDIQLIVLNETCEGKNNGSFEVTIDNQEYTFIVSLDGSSIGTANFGNPLVYNNLADGNYQVCLTVQELPDFEQCFGIVISTYQRLEVEASGIDVSNLKAKFNVQGSKNYEVLINEKIYNFQFKNTANKILEIPIEKGKNLVSITGESDCQGIYTDIIIIGNVTVFPNPVDDILNFSGFEAKGKAQINVYTMSGILTRSIQKNIENRDFNIQLSGLPKGMYLIKVVSASEKIEFKIIKK